MSRRPELPPTSVRPAVADHGPQLCECLGGQFRTDTALCGGTTLVGRHLDPDAALCGETFEWVFGRATIAIVGKVLHSVTMPLDGFIAGPGGDMSWLTPYPGPNPEIEELQRDIGARLERIRVTAVPYATNLHARRPLIRADPLDGQPSGATTSLIRLWWYAPKHG